MLTIDQLLSRVVERKGYTVQGADAEALMARKGDETLLAAWKTDGPLDASDVQVFLQAFEQVRAASGILLAPAGVEPAAKDALAQARGVEVWAESRIVLEVGEALVKDAWDGRHPPAPAVGPAGPASLPPTPTRTYPQAAGGIHASLVAKAAASVGSNSGAAYFMPSKPTRSADLKADIPQGRGGSLGYAWGGPGGGTASPGIAQVRSGRHPSRQVDQWGNLVDPAKAKPATPTTVVGEDDVEIISTPKKGSAPRAAAAAAPAMAPTLPAPAAEEAYEIISAPKKTAARVAAPQAPPACNTLAVKLSKDEALAKVQAKPGAIVKLALVPHVAFEYDVHLERPGMPAPVEGKGALLVSSLTGDLRTVDGLAYAPAEPTDARKDQEKLQAVDLYEKVKGHMTKTFSRTMNVEREVAGNTVMETLKLVPDPDEMGLQHRGVVYVPVWEITGGGVNTKVDAFTGQAL